MRPRRGGRSCLAAHDPNYFVENNIHTLVASDRQEMLSQLGSTEVNLVILDLRLGQEDGLDLLREIRSSSDVPVIIITGHRRDDIDRVVGLELGADDYLTKPFNLRELLARVRAVLRRFDIRRATPARDPERGRFRFSGWQLDCKTRQLTDPAGAPVALTKGEYALLLAFLDAPQRPLSREHLLQATRVHEGCLRSQHRRADSSPAAQARTRPQRATRHPDRARRRICVRRSGRAGLNASNKREFPSFSHPVSDRELRYPRPQGGRDALQDALKKPALGNLAL